jgi:hypothetical protein
VLARAAEGPEKAPEQHAELMAFVDKAVGQLKAQGVRTQVGITSHHITSHHITSLLRPEPRTSHT